MTGVLPALAPYGIALIRVLRRVLSRHGGTFELSYRVRPQRADGCWLLGTWCYSGETLEWFRILLPVSRFLALLGAWPPWWLCLRA